jgi:hypothetical protein
MRGSATLTARRVIEGATFRPDRGEPTRRYIDALAVSRVQTIAIASSERSLVREPPMLA